MAGSRWQGVGGRESVAGSRWQGVGSRESVVGSRYWFEVKSTVFPKPDSQKEGLF